MTPEEPRNSTLALPPLTDAQIADYYARLRESEKILEVKLIGVVKTLLFYGIVLFLGQLVLFKWKWYPVLNGLTLPITLIGLYCSSRLKKPHRGLVANLNALTEGSDDPRLLSIKMAAYTDEDEPQPKARLKKTMQRMSPRLTFEDAASLNLTDRNTLRDWLKDEDRETVLGALHVVTLLGDKRALKVVEELHAGKHLASSEPGRVEAAGQCLPQLRERIAALERGEDLLRASTPPQMDETLLRPLASFSYPNSEEAQQLLRASSPSEQS